VLFGFRQEQKVTLVLFGRYITIAETQSMCVLCALTCIGTVTDTFIELIEKRKSKLCQVVVGCALAFSLAIRNSRPEPGQVEKGPSTQPINATSLIEG
jgi:hypothetical protein